LDVDENNDVEDLLDKLKQMLQDEFKEKIEWHIIFHVGAW
jgi:dsRNA-specific ribonuclease